MNDDLAALQARIDRTNELLQHMLAEVAKTPSTHAIFVDAGYLYAAAGRLVAGTLDRERVLDLIVDKALELVGGGACGIFRLEPDGWLRFARGRGLSRALVEGLRVRPAEGNSGRALAERWTTRQLDEAMVALDERHRTT